MEKDLNETFVNTLGEDISEDDIDTTELFNDDDTTEETNTTEQPKLGKQFDMTALSKGIKTDVDLTFVIDLTRSMKPLLDIVKGMTLTLFEDTVKALAEKKRNVDSFRVKVIPFRDYYCDGEYAMDESRFFNLPEEKEAFSEYVLSLEADGGGDEPENALEALALAMRSDWVKAVTSNEKARNVIVLFTDASAHPFEKAEDGVTPFYPENMLTSLADLKLAWEGQNTCAGSSYLDQYMMDQSAKRLIIYAPTDSYPWNEISTMKNVKLISIEPARGGAELDRTILLEDIAGSIR